MRESPSTAIVIPTLGTRNQLLSDALASINEQAIPVTVVVVGPSRVELMTEVDAAGAIFVTDPQRGLSAAINVGFDAVPSGTEFVGWLGDDDLLMPGGLAAAVAALRRSPRAVLAFGWCDYIDEDGLLLFRSRAGGWASRVLPWGPNLIPQPGSLMKLSALRTVGGLDEELSFAMDLDLFLRLRKVGDLVALPRTLSAFRWHPDSLTVRNQRKSMDESDFVRRRHLPRLASATFVIWKWPVRWALSVVKLVVKRRSASRQAAEVSASIKAE